MKLSLRSTSTACALTLLLLATGCHRHRKSRSASNTDAYSDQLHQLVQKKSLPPEKVDATKLPNLRWPNFSDYEPIVSTFYDDRNYEVAWTRDGAPTATATAFIQQFQDAGAKGLIPEDYDASRWNDRIQALHDKSADAISLFDVAMTVNVMRFISDLRIGRVNPSHFNFEIPVQDKKYDLAEFVSDNAVDSDDLPKLISSVEPDSDQYRQTEAALAHYLDLAKQQQQANADPLPTISKTIPVNGTYPAAAALLTRLQLEGDAPADTIAPTTGTTYTSDLSAAVKHYQARHGIEPDGKLSAQIIKSLNVPLTARVVQLQDSLERWRWLPDPYLHPRLMVNLPEFLLRGYTTDNKEDFSMRVVVGQAKDNHDTPVFAHMMKYLVFRPYWNVPNSIARKELVPHINANRGYLASKNFEVTNNKGVVLTDYTASQVAQGGVMVREKPGPKNSLGLVKFMFPNQYDIYLHSTPAVSLFDRSRRDFSHGCVRVQKPADLAVWVLGQSQTSGDWDMDKVQDAMNNGQDNKTVSLKTQLPIVIFYLTAIVAEDGQTHFFDDIYGYDAAMQQVFSKGPPYPVKPEPVVPKTKPGETV
jgi:murein L,D-transpeptidase YcbB/YkuD